MGVHRLEVVFRAAVLLRGDTGCSFRSGKLRAELTDLTLGRKVPIRLIRRGCGGSGRGWSDAAELQAARDGLPIGPTYSRDADFGAADHMDAADDRPTTVRRPSDNRPRYQ